MLFNADLARRWIRLRNAKPALRIRDTAVALGVGVAVAGHRLADVAALARFADFG